jgi:hypothetical protein
LAAAASGFGEKRVERAMAADFACIAGGKILPVYVLSVNFFGGGRRFDEFLFSKFYRMVTIHILKAILSVLQPVFFAL